jgi:hypothetical protein
LDRIEFFHLLEYLHQLVAVEAADVAVLRALLNLRSDLQKVFVDFGESTHHLFVAGTAPNFLDDCRGIANENVAVEVPAGIVLFGMVQGTEKTLNELVHDILVGRTNVEDPDQRRHLLLEENPVLEVRYDGSELRVPEEMCYCLNVCPPLPQSPSEPLEVG